MRKLYSILVALIIAPTIFGQAPSSFKYQTVIRNSSGQLIINTQVNIQIAILKGSISGNPVYTEIFSPMTNDFGLVNLDIGAGTVVSGNFETIDWGVETYFIKVWLNDTEMGTSQLLSVPYALYANKAETISEDAITGNENAFTGWDKSSLDDFDGKYSSLSNVPTFAPIATSGSYDDLTDKPILFDGTWASLSGKPTFATVAASGLFDDLLNKPTTLSGFGISDAMSTSHTANGITSTDITNWNDAFSWGNHTGLYKLESYKPAWEEIIGEPTFAPIAISGSYNDLTDKPILFDGTWTSLSGKPTFAAVATSGLFADLLNKPTTLSGFGISDAMSTSHAANGITSIDIINWNDAYSWGDHSTIGYQQLIEAGTVTQYWRGDKTWQTLNKQAVGLGNVENIQLSTWAGSSNLSNLGTITSGIWNAGAITSSSSVTANMFIKTGGTSSQFLKADGSVDNNNYTTALREVTDEFNATFGQTGFTLTHIPSATSKVKMYINGVRISNTAYSTTNNIITYISANNGSYTLTTGDRIQFDYSY
jgi:hypothetical protein